MGEFKHLPEAVHGKIVPLNFGHIQHLTGSRMLDSEDKLIGKRAELSLTVNKEKVTDKIYVTEKIDGMNAGVVKKKGVLYPISRKGYDVRFMGTVHEKLVRLGMEWAYWVDDHYGIYNNILSEGERLVFEDCIIRSTLSYKFKDDPVFLLAKYSDDGTRMLYEDLVKLGEVNNIAMPALLCSGIAINPVEVVRQYPIGVNGITDSIEGVVYVKEADGRFVFSAKYVNNTSVGSAEQNLTEYNTFKRRFI